MYFVLESLEGKKKKLEGEKDRERRRRGHPPVSSPPATVPHVVVGDCHRAMDEAVSAGTAACCSWSDREMGRVVTAPLSAPCATTPRDMVFPGMPLARCVSPGPDPGVPPAGTARPRLPAVPARPGLMQAAFPGKPGHFPTGWGSRTSGEATGVGSLQRCCGRRAQAGRHGVSPRRS